MRMLCRDVKLVIVDEATASMDGPAERNLLEALRGERDGKTVILVTHKFNQLVEEADLIVYVLFLSFALILRRPKIDVLKISTSSKLGHMPPSLRPVVSIPGSSGQRCESEPRLSFECTNIL
jgi:ABC-type Mn2+/Zn2+ transport system ATPase subunit